jgi:foldase protein PrsA
VAAAVALAACGGGVPGNSVAKVGDHAVTKADFDHWLGVAARQLAQQQGVSASSAVVPDPPAYARCVAAKRKAAPAPAKGQPKPTDASFKAACKSEYGQLRDSVMQFLISAQWILGETKDQDLSVTPKDVDKALADIKKQQFPKESDFTSFLKSSGMSLDDARFRVKINALTTKLQNKVVKGKDKVTDKAVAAYYAKNESRFSAPERRDLRIVLTKTKAKAEQAKAALRSGRSWKSVAKSFSIDQGSKDKGGVLLNVSKGTQEKALDTAVFAAKRNTLAGPVKTQFGYYVFTVTKVTAASRQTLAQATPTIKQLLAGQQQQNAINKFSGDFAKKWTNKTNCRSGYVVTDCKNAPKPKTTSTAATTG